MSEINDTIKLVKNELKATLKGTLSSIKGDIDAYAGQLASTAMLYAQYKASGNETKAEATRRHLRAQALSLRSITTAKEAKRWEATWWKIVNIAAKTLLAALTTL